MRIHIDSDFGGDPDDACALAMLLGWREIQVVGLTTNLEVGGQRAGCAKHYLEMAGRPDIPVVAGAEATATSFARYNSTWGDTRYWPEPVEPLSSAPGNALNLLARNIAGGATVVAIGALTNLAMLEVVRPGSLSHTKIVAMGGWIEAPSPGYPQWGPEADFNIQCDTRSAEIVVKRCGDLTLMPLPVAMAAQLRGSELRRLKQAGPMGELLARQSSANARDNQVIELPHQYPDLADDLVNFHWDPITCAAAVAWPGVRVEERALVVSMDEGVLRWNADPRGKPIKVVTHIDGCAFGEVWIQAVERACQLAINSRDRQSVVSE